jgi:hypothetical protein
MRKGFLKVVPESRLPKQSGGGGRCQVNENKIIENAKKKYIEKIIL